MSGFQLAAEDLRKSYSGRLVVGGVSIKVEAGEVVPFGVLRDRTLLDPNSAGRITLTRRMEK
ncbi:MAG: hypothetical protein IJS28_03975 [Synergistaceae bacterium]|nr:hypothetical protein [Synergistaceae bacterium]